MLDLHNLFNKLSGNVGERKDENNAALYIAVKNGNLGEVKRLLKDGADPNAVNAQHLTPLHQAAYWGETEIVALLLKHGAKADADNGKCWTPLHSAALAGGLKSRYEIINMLLASGADPDKADKHGWTPKDYMTIWDVDARSAEKLKQYMLLMEGQKAGVRAPKKPNNLRTPKH